MQSFNLDMNQCAVYGMLLMEDLPTLTIYKNLMFAAALPLSLDIFDPSSCFCAFPMSFITNTPL